MVKKVTDAIKPLISRLETRSISVHNAFLGFDACIDVIVRVVKEKNEDNHHEFFNDSRQFGEFLIGLENRSCGVELKTILSKIGGNMVIMGNALGNLGIKSDCLGTFGSPEILPVFHSMSPNCSLISIGDTITATALEFIDSKVIVFDPGPYNDLSWQGIKDIAGLDNLIKLLSGKELISFVNWSEIEQSTKIWNGFLDDAIPFIEQSPEKPLFFTDFSDCSRKSKEEIKDVLNLLDRFRKYFRIVVSLNQNEAHLISSALDISDAESDENLIRKLYEPVNCDILTIHRVDDALAFDGFSYETCSTFKCSQPVILTGGGDNFNAGFCFSLLNGLDLFQSLVVANAVSGSYVKTGISPSVENLIRFLKQVD